MSTGFKAGNPGCSCSCAPTIICATCSNCDGSAGTGTVTVTDGGAFSATCTLPGTLPSKCCVTVPAGGTYTVTWNGTGKSQSATVATGATYNASFCLGDGSSTGSPGGCTICTTVSGCGLAMSGVTVTATQGGSTVASGTTDATGKVCLCVPTSGSPNTTLTVTGTVPSRYTTGATTTVSGSSLVPCATINAPGLAVSPASGNHCVPCASCPQPLPIPDSLTLTDSALGITATLAWNGSGTTHTWQGSGHFSYGGCAPNCSAAGNVCVTYTFGFIPGNGYCLQIAYTGFNFFNSCPRSDVAGDCSGAGSGDAVRETFAYGCPPGFTATVTLNSAVGHDDGLFNLYCGGTSVISITE